MRIDWIQILRVRQLVHRSVLGHEIRVLGVNLHQPWQRIHAELLGAFGGGAFGGECAITF